MTTEKMLTSELEAFLDARILAGDAIMLVYALPYSSTPSQQFVYVTYDPA